MQTDVKELGNLQLREQENITLYSADGKVLSVLEFAREHLDSLSELEQELIKEHLDELPTQTPTKLTYPLVRTQQYSNGIKKTPAKRAGTRSAYIPNLKLKIKGCRPEDATFPEWKVDEKFNLKVDSIPFGVLTAESAMREILAYCLMKKRNIPIPAEHIAVFEYRPGGKFMNYGLVSEMPGDTRLEQFIDCSGYTIGDIVRLKKKDERVLGHEVKLQTLDVKEYVNIKTDLLMKFNFNGGFRGILNSNIGNDIIRNATIHSICDFDTFNVIKVPDRLEQSSIKYFVMRSFIELIKTSMPFVDYLEFTGETDKEIHSSLASYYKKRSSVYEAYRKRFLAQTKRVGWDRDYVEKCIEKAFETSVSFELLQELIPNNHTFKTFRPDSYYVPHN